MRIVAIYFLNNIGHNTCKTNWLIVLSFMKIVINITLRYIYIDLFYAALDNFIEIAF